MAVVAGEDRGRVRAVAGRHRAGHRLVLARASSPGDAPGRCSLTPKATSSACCDRTTRWSA